ncbi:hypothetical protein HMPREF1624_03563 [Sporothrix schenckii ATCC 58251]|uniref:Nitrogen regulatory protein areA GATA-like domain-containing protein n=1 Tax=Sporothrix schenckii (strain ATCC 58251 / de Perez 2211183) TaxID=1391915 RepID=U7PX72_SPOS1|nr:hypothetical protein HMPREF1624_03563 [Sporothrix schenckii ATCC 58251]
MATSVIPGSDRGSLKATKADRLCESEKPTSSSNDIPVQVAGLVKQATAAASKTDPPTHVPLDAAALALHNAEQDSIEAALPILPRGFVENTAEIYAEVASFEVIPPEKLREYWRVYTITHRKLYDPTANRLENFWWHVWGSKRRGLSGKIVAKLYENISTGPTFVPLRTPASRYDGPTISFMLPPPSITATTATGTSNPPGSSKQSASDDQRPSQDAPVSGASSHAAAVAPKRVNNADSTTEGERADTGTLDHKQAQQDAHVKLLSSSSTRPAPAQSILRKPRPSLSGPRPTPRFALPSGEPSEAEEDEQNVQLGGSSEANEDAVTSASSIGSGNGSTDTNHSDHRESKPIKHSSSSSNNSNSKTASSKREAVTKSGKGKAAKKKFVVNSSASKRRTVVSKRSGSHGSQSSGASEGPGSREPPSYFPPRHSGESLVGVEEEELEDAILPPALSSPQSPNPMPSKSRVLKQQRRSPKLAAMTEKAAGKQPAGHQPLADPERTSSPASESTAVSSVSGSVAGSVTGTTTAPAPTLATASRKRSSFAQYVTGASGGPGSLASSGGSSGGLEVPVAFRNRQSTQRPKIPGGPEAIPRPGGGLIRQSTMPYEPGQSHRQQLSRISLTTTMPSSRGTAHALPPTSAYVGPGSAAAPGLSAAAPAAPMMGRSMSQDSYGTRPRLIPGYQSPILGPMRSSTVTAASMVAAKGVFMDAEGPDTFELYAKTGLEEPPEEPDDDDKEDSSELPAYMSETGSFSSSFQAPSSFQNAASSSFQDTQPALPRPLFTPTRPAQTPRIPFARTRSQLNVILDREKERLGEGSYASWRESRTRDQHEPGDREHRNS